MLTGAQNAENGLGYDFFFGVKPQRWWWISQSHCNMWWNLGSICES
jgi:hypothetical protein